jgi:hypothetical protein
MSYVNTLSKVFGLLGISQEGYSVYSYLSTVKIQPTLTQIANQLSLHRPRLYQALDELERHNLIRKTNQKWVVTDPMALLVQVRHLNFQTQSMYSSLEEILPELRANYNFIEDQKLITLEYNRLKIIKQYYDMLDPKTADIQYIFNCGDELLAIFGVDFKEYGRLRNSYGIKLKILSNPSDKLHRINKEFFHDQNAEVKYLPTSYISLPAFIVFGNQSIYWEPEVPRNIIVNDQRIADLNREIFDGIWKSIID